MGILGTIGQWVVTNLPTVAKLVKKVAGFVHKTADAVDALLEGRKVLTEDTIPQTEQPRRKSRAERPDILSDPKPVKDKISALVKSIDENKKSLQTASHTNEIQHRRIQVQIDVMELIVSSQTFARFTHNISLHAANLQIHLQTIQNTVGLLDAVNRQRVGIKALMQTVNHLVDVVGAGDKVKKIKGIDVDMRPGSISIWRAYEAFENTRGLLIDEIDSFTGAVDEQLERVEHVRVAAHTLTDTGAKVSSWLEVSVEPKLLDAKKQAESLRGELSVIPRLESNLRRDLENVKEDAL